MKISLFLVALLATFALTNGQYDEECHYECITTYCDLFGSYCDYDCHEVCYPYRKSAEVAQGAQVTKTAAGLATGGLRSLVAGHQPDVSVHERESSIRARTGKVVRMRIQNPSPAQESRMKMASSSTRSPAPAKFALFQSCLSNSGAGSLDKF